MNSLPRRADALDALRGLAILLMVLSGSIHFANHLPAWMYHAQVPPPEFKFKPDLPGITWVDLVFPFFLFSMGAAFPFGLSKKIQNGIASWKINLQVLQRGLLLVAFAIFLQHTKPFLFSADPQAVDWIIGLLSFGVMFVVLVRFPASVSPSMIVGLKAAGVLSAVALLSLLQFPDGSGFQLTRSDIIIIVLANVALFGSLIWIYTRENILFRLGILGILMALRLTQGIEGSWNQMLWTFTPFPWMYKLYYLQYLFIVIPGSIAGDLIYRWINTERTDEQEHSSLSDVRMMILLLTMTSAVIVTVAGLFMRAIGITITFDLILFAVSTGILNKGKSSTEQLFRSLFHWGSFWLLLGFFFEAYEGGIKKDHPTMSYYFVTTGLAHYSYIAFSIVTDHFRRSRIVGLLIDNGKNPMIAYVAGNVFVLPILSLTGLTSVLNMLTVDPWLGFVKGLIFTLLVALTTAFCTKKKLMWRT
jgi:predicted acyltransferase